MLNITEIRKQLENIRTNAQFALDAIMSMPIEAAEANERNLSGNIERHVGNIYKSAAVIDQLI